MTRRTQYLSIDGNNRKYASQFFQRMKTSSSLPEDFSIRQIQKFTKINPGKFSREKYKLYKFIFFTYEVGIQFSSLILVSLYSITIFPVLGYFLLLLSLSLIFTHLKSGQFWLVSYKGKVVAYARVYEYHDHITLMNLRVSRNHQRRKVGSSLIMHLMKEYGKPIYVTPTISSHKFYTRIGFVPAWECKGHPLESAKCFLVLR